MSEHNITSAQYVQDIDGNNSVIKATINGITWDVPMKTDNSHYQAILEWVAEGNTITDNGDNE